ncbi:MAG: hypothetical protein H0X41_12285 [Chitinophagaceae bacterium]|nr:hypothetical protein [Chitinophagaceae bacterium]
MKKNILLFAFLCSLLSVFASTPVEPSPKTLRASSIKFQVGPDKQWISLEDVANMKPRQFAAITHQHMNILQRAGFALAQKKLRNSIDADGTVNNKRLQAMVTPMLDGDTGFHMGGFALGFLLGLIGLLIAYLINDDKKANRRKWAWLGFGIFVVLYLVLILALA